MTDNETCSENTNYCKLRLRNADEMSDPLQNSRFAILNSPGACLLPPQNDVP